MPRPEPIAYLSARGLSLDVIRSTRLGWDGERLTFPMFDASDALVAFKTRVPEPRAQMRAWPGEGRAWPLYPTVDRRAGWMLLVAGEFDALAARSAGLPASSVTLGAGHWRNEWTTELTGLRVIVCFDNNEERQGRDRVARLRAAGIYAHRLDLRTLGLDTPKGDLSDYLNGGGDPGRLRLRRRVRRSTR